MGSEMCIRDSIKENYQLWLDLKNAPADELPAMYQRWQENATHDLWVVGHNGLEPQLTVMVPGAHGVDPKTGERPWLGIWFD